MILRLPKVEQRSSPKTNQKLYCVKELYLRDNMGADFKEASWEEYGMELCG